VGYRIAKGEKLSDILADLGEVAEGVRTAQIMKLIVDHLNIQAPLLQGIYKVLFEGLELERAVRFVMKHYNEADAAYIDL
jgi:glycerol-3-phosphate dehydrogenase (NAD(P)+)